MSYDWLGGFKAGLGGATTDEWTDGYAAGAEIARHTGKNSGGCVMTVILLATLSILSTRCENDRRREQILCASRGGVLVVSGMPSRFYDCVARQ